MTAARPAGTTAPQPGRGYIAGIDSLRALAVLSVLVYHVRPAWLPAGFLGVDVFFAISGYVVASSLAKPGSLSRERAALAFYARRLVRLYPALALCLLSTFLAVVLFVPSSWLSTTTWGTGLLAFAGLSNFALVWLAEPYFSPRAEFNPFTHTWSLAVEEQFYLLFPWLAAAWLAVGPAGALRRQVYRLAPVLVLTLASMAWCAWATAHRPDLAFYMLPSRFWELAVGVWLARLHAGGGGLSPSWGRWAPAMAVSGAAIAAAALAFAPRAGFPWPGALWSLCGALLFLQGVAAAQANRLRLGWAELAPILYLGRVSYSLYLWHWPVLVLMRWTIGLEGSSAVVIASSVSLLLAALTHHVLENPMRRRFSAGRPGWVLSVGWGGVAVIAAVCLGLVQARPWVSQTTAMKHAKDWYPVATDEDKGLTRDAQDGALRVATLFVVGDSHAMAYAPMLARVQAQTGWQVQVIAEAGCAVAKPSTEMPENCVEFLESAWAKVLDRAAAGDVIFLPGLRHARIADQWGAEPIADVLKKEARPQVVQARESALARAQAWLAEAQARRVRVILEGPKPVFASPVFRCVDSFNRGNPVCAQGLAMPRATLEPLIGPAREMLAALQLRGASMWEPFDALCPGQVCEAMDSDGSPLYFDADHLSRHANLKLTQGFIDTLRGATPAPDGR